MNIVTERLVLTSEDVRLQESVRDSYRESIEAGQSKALRVTMRAITADKVTRNGTYYPHSELQGDGETRGVVTLTSPYPVPILTDHRSTGNSMLTSGDMPVPLGRVIGGRIVTTRKNGRTERYLEVDALITDPVAIERVLNGQYLTVSIGHIPDRVHCSICGARVEGFECSSGHVRGSYYEVDGEQKQCYHTMHGIQFIEISFVNVPSDNAAMVVTKQMESGSFHLGELQDLDLPARPAQTEQVDEDVQVLIEDGGDHMEPSIQETFLIDEVPPFLGEAKLTAAQRKKLPDSAFCGPNRSFPAHDRAHVVAGLRLLGRAKLSPAQKARVRACLIRKGRQLGMYKDDDGEATVLVLHPHSLEYLVLTADRMATVPESLLAILSTALVESVAEARREGYLLKDGLLLVEAPSEEDYRLLEAAMNEADLPVPDQNTEASGTDEPEEDQVEAESGTSSDSVQESDHSHQSEEAGAGSDDPARDAESESLKSELEQLRSELERFKADLERVSSELTSARDEVERWRTRAESLEREQLVERVARAAIAAGYPLARCKTFSELCDIFSERSTDSLKQLLSDLQVDLSDEDLREALSDVKNPVEGLPEAGADGLPEDHDVRETQGRAPEPVGIDEILDALRSGRIPVRETEEDSEVFRLYF